MEIVGYKHIGNLQTKTVLIAMLATMWGMIMIGCVDTESEEVRTVIQKYESSWLSANVALNPTLKYDLATKQWADYMGIPTSHQGVSGLLTTSATVNDVTVIEYSSARLKAWACTTNTFDEITLQGTIVRSGTLSRCGTYVFWKMDANWKLAGYYNDADRRYWNHAPEWLKTVIGDLPNN